MILIDSSAWLEILSKGALSHEINKYMRESKSIIVPTVVIFEVYRKIAKAISQDEGLAAVVFISTHEVVDISREVALTAADLSIQYGLGMADSLVLAVAQEYNAVLLTLDYDFHKIPGTKVLRRKA
ncbi:MAG TPA: type II toxin-antitoxin system VapC family toxin [Bdellovibrionota bacterium]|nr:type II toxin-antitoxin system VapC family toxin [Bdellovibrionota bacterium]